MSRHGAGPPSEGPPGGHARPSPAVVVAIAALVAAFAGTAVAEQGATTSVSTKKTKKIAKQQARKQINKLVPGLVPDPASAYAQRGDETIDLPEEPTEVLATKLTTSARGRILASATLSLRGDTPAAAPDERATCAVRIGNASGPSIEANAPPTTPRRFVIGAQFATGELDPGTYDVALICTQVSGDVQARQGALTAWTN